MSAAVANQQIPAVASTFPPGHPGFTGITPTGPEPSAPPPPYREIDGDFPQTHPGLAARPPTTSIDQLTGHPQSQHHHAPNYILAQQYGDPHGGQLEYFQHYGGHSQPHQNMNAYGQPGNTHHFQGQASHIGQPPSQVGYLSPGSITYTPSGQPSLLQPPPSLHSYYSLKESCALSITTLAFFVCVVPMAIFELSYDLNEDRKNLTALTEVIISDLVFWLLAIRTLVVPFFWVTTGSFERPRPI